MEVLLTKEKRTSPITILSTNTSQYEGKASEAVSLSKEAAISCEGSYRSSSQTICMKLDLYETRHGKEAA